MLEAFQYTAVAKKPRSPHAETYALGGLIVQGEAAVLCCGLTAFDCGTLFLFSFEERTNESAPVGVPKTERTLALSSVHLVRKPWWYFRAVVRGWARDSCTLEVALSSRMFRWAVS